MKRIAWNARLASVGALAAALVAIGAVVAEPRRAATETPMEPELQDQLIPRDVGAPSSAVRILDLTGTVQTVEKNFLGQPKTVEIVSTEMRKYLIEDAGKGRELKSHVGEKVTLTAVLKRGEDGKEYLVVESYRVHES